MKNIADNEFEPIHHVITKEKVTCSQPVYEKIVANYPTDDVIKFEAPSTSQQSYKVDVSRPVRIYCDGIYDLFHYGHARSLAQAKNLFKNVCLIVGIPNDKVTLEFKGEMVLTATERIESLRHCRYVDEIVENAPWVVTNEFLDKYRIDFVAHDDAPYAGGGVSDIYAPIKEMNRFIPTKRTIGISTTGIITNIVKRYDTYVRRNLERGISAKDLNISKFKELDYRFQKSMRKFSARVKRIVTKVENAIDYCDNLSNSCIEKFIEKFGPNGFWGKIRKSKTAGVSVKEANC